MSDDNISRKAAIDALHMHLMYRMGTDSNKKRLDEWINNLPSVQPERKKGKWIHVHPLQSDDSGAYMCSACKVGMWEVRPSAYHYCPNCGADMRGEQNE